MVHVFKRADQPRLFCGNCLFQYPLADPQFFGEKQGIGLFDLIDIDGGPIDTVKNDRLLHKI